MARFERVRENATMCEMKLLQEDLSAEMYEDRTKPTANNLLSMATILYPILAQLIQSLNMERKKIFSGISVQPWF